MGQLRLNDLAEDQSEVDETPTGALRRLQGGVRPMAVTVAQKSNAVNPDIIELSGLITKLSSRLSSEPSDISHAVLAMLETAESKAESRRNALQKMITEVSGKAQHR